MVAVQKSRCNSLVHSFLDLKDVGANFFYHILTVQVVHVWDPITRRLHFPYKPCESTFARIFLFLERHRALGFRHSLFNVQSERSYRYISHVVEKYIFVRVLSVLNCRTVANLLPFQGTNINVFNTAQYYFESKTPRQ